jgi:hypothetical protein
VGRERPLRSTPVNVRYVWRSCRSQEDPRSAVLDPLRKYPPYRRGVWFSVHPTERGGSSSRRVASALVMPGGSIALRWDSRRATAFCARVLPAAPAAPDSELVRRVRQRPQMARRRVGCALHVACAAPGLSPLRHCGDTHAPTPTGDYRPSLCSPWPAAGVGPAAHAMRIMAGRTIGRPCMLSKPARQLANRALYWRRGSCTPPQVECVARADRFRDQPTSGYQRGRRRWVQSRYVQGRSQC